ncbi:MAG: hypothetical protein RLZZ387_1360, partial [Chloroflexota bacterium]
MITTYQQALDYLYSFIAGERQTPRPPPELNLTRTAALLSAMGEPQRAFPSVIVAGTKGKGSTCAMIEAMARESGLRVGLWTSPHLHSYRERIQVHRRLIAQGELVRLVELARPHVDDVTRATGGAPVTFAIGFAVAMRYFAEVGVDLAVLEVGLGGRYDSANVVAPILSVITSISYDHLDILGDTLTQIAWQKAGVMKRGVPTATLRQDPEAMRVLEAYAAEVGAELHVVRDEADRQPSATDRQGMVPAGGASVAEPHGDTAVDLASLHLGLAGSYQRDNALLSLGAARLLRRSLALTDAGIASGLANVRWPGRMEVVGGEPPVVVDGAHNGDSARRLLESLGELFPGRRLVLVFG